MTGIFALSFFLAAAPSFATTTKYNSEEALRIAVGNENAYFVPTNKDDVTSWNGTVYDYDSKKCFLIKHNADIQSIQSSETKCQPAVFKAATEPYDLIPKFEAFRKKFSGCVKTRDQKCLHRLTWRRIQISFGVDGMGDRRMSLYPKWKKAEWEEILGLLKKGVSDSGDEREFPHPQAEGYVGMRGSFEKRNGGWLLTSYLGGD